jgi:hypothetical protein
MGAGRLKGWKRHILVDTLGLLLSVAVHRADIQDRDGAFELFAGHVTCSSSASLPTAATAGEKMPLMVARTGSWKLEIVKRSGVANGFEVLPKH